MFKFFDFRIPCSCLNEKCEELMSSPDFIKDALKCMSFHRLPQPGEGFGKGDYYLDEIGPWKDFCANCYSDGASVYTCEWEGTNDISTPKFECSRCEMAWYCTQKCQDRHWKVHEHRCKAST